MTDLWATAVLTNRPGLLAVCEFYFWGVRLWHRKRRLLSDIWRERECPTIQS